MQNSSHEPGETLFAFQPWWKNSALTLLSGGPWYFCSSPPKQKISTPSPLFFFNSNSISHLEKKLLEICMKPFFTDAFRDIQKFNKKTPFAETGRVSHDLPNVLLFKSSVDLMFSFCPYSFAHACSLFKMWSHHSQGDTAYSTSICSRW